MERLLLERFQRAAHLYLPTEILPKEEDWLGWMSLIQHYGGPTRLLDFTESFYCASYFAVEQTATRAAIWCVNRRALEEEVLTALNFDRGELRALEIRRGLRWALNEEVGLRTARRAIFPFFPDRLHERLAQQQGLFLACGRVDVPFDEQLFDALRVHRLDLASRSAYRREIQGEVDMDAQQLLRLVKIEIEPKLHKKARAELKRMNLTAQSIYPGPDGYARALHWEMGFHLQGESDYVPKNLGNAKDLGKRLRAKQTGKAKT